MAAVLVVLGSATVSSGQVIIYELKFEHETGFNLDFFEGGYFVAPALGGAGTFILTSRESGRKILTSSAGTGNFFHGIDEDGKRISVISAGGGDGSTSLASYVAFGEVTGSVEIETSDATFKVKVARKLKGTSIAAGDETSTTSSSSSSTTDTTTNTTTTTDTSTDTTTTTDTGTSTDTTTDTGSSTGTSTGSTSSLNSTSGFVNISSLEVNYDSGHTRTVNEKDLTLEEAVDALTLELKQMGYVEASSTSTAATSGSNNSTSTGSSTTTTTTPTTTTSAPEIAVSQGGTSILDGGTLDMGAATTGTPFSFTFTISNTGAADLTGVLVTVDGADATDVSVTASPAVSVTALTGSTTFTVQFTPSTAGAKTAALHISSNDSDENPFDINLTGTGN